MGSSKGKVCEMKNAFEYEVELNGRGKLLKKRFSIGPIVVWAIVAIVLCFAGRALLNIPPSFWRFFGR